MQEKQQQASSSSSSAAAAANVFTELRAAAAALVEAHPEVVRVDEAAVERLASTLAAQDVRGAAERVGLPLKFGNALEELNFHACVALLGFGAAYEGELAESARDTVLFGLIGLHLTKADLHAGFLLTANRGDVSGYFNIDPMESVPHESIPAIRIERPGPLSDYVDALVAAMNTTGQRLKELGEPDMARFALSALKSDGAGGPPTAARLVAALAAAFPTTFGEPLHEGFVPHKKALALAAECYHRLRPALPAMDFADFARAPGYATPTVITHLAKLGVLKPPGEEARVGDEAAGCARLLEKPENVTVLSAAVVLALDALAAKWGGAVAPLDVAYYFDEVYGKQKEQGQEQGQEQESEAPEGQQERQQEGQEKKAAQQLKFVPPRGQMVM